jgi:hypothetical protein
MESANAIRDAIRNGEIAGNVDEDKDSFYAHVTADPKAVDAYFAKAAPKIFSEPTVRFQRLK